MAPAVDQWNLIEGPEFDSAWRQVFKNGIALAAGTDVSIG